MSYGKRTAANVTFTLAIEPEHVPVRGNYLTSGDDEQDRADEDALIARLEAGDDRAWCCLIVTCEDEDGNTATDSLGCVNIGEDAGWGARLEAHVKETFPDLWSESLDRLNADLGYTDDTDPAVRALAEHLDIDPCEVSAAKCGDCAYDADGGEYLVLTDSERETAADERLESYIDECLLPGVSETLAMYFDRASWKRDALLSDGYGHTISGYDGEEHEVRQADGSYLYIYRMN